MLTHKLKNGLLGLPPDPFHFGTFCPEVVAELRSFVVAEHSSFGAECRKAFPYQLCFAIHIKPNKNVTI